MTELRVIAGVWGLSHAQVRGNGPRNRARREMIQQTPQKCSYQSPLSSPWADSLTQRHFPAVDPIPESRKDPGRVSFPPECSVPISSHPNSLCAALGKGNRGKDLGSQHLPQSPGPGVSASPTEYRNMDGAAPLPLPPGGNSRVFGKIKGICCPWKRNSEINCPAGRLWERQE